MFDFTLPVFVIVRGTTGIAQLKVQLAVFTEELKKLIQAKRKTVSIPYNKCVGLVKIVGFVNGDATN